RSSAHEAGARRDTGAGTVHRGRRRHESMKRMLPSVAAVVAIGLIAAVSAGAKSSDSRLTGAGSTFVSPLVSLWAADYASTTRTQIAYTPVGHGTTISEMTL